MQNAPSRSRRRFLGSRRRMERRPRRLPREGRPRQSPSRGAGGRRQPLRIAIASHEKTARFFNQNTKVPLEEASSRTPLHDTYGIITPSSLHFERHHSGVPDIDPAVAHADDSRSRRSPARLQRRRAEEAAVGLADSLSRVLGQQRRRVARRLDRIRRAAHPWPDQLQRMDRRPGRRAPARVRRPSGRHVGAGRRRRRGQARPQHPDAENHGRCAGRVRRKTANRCVPSKAIRCACCFPAGKATPT